MDRHGRGHLTGSTRTSDRARGDALSTAGDAEACPALTRGTADPISRDRGRRRAPADREGVRPPCQLEAQVGPPRDPPRSTRPRRSRATNGSARRGARSWSRPTACGDELAGGGRRPHTTPHGAADRCGDLRCRYRTERSHRPPAARLRRCVSGGPRVHVRSPLDEGVCAVRGGPLGSTPRAFGLAPTGPPTLTSGAEGRHGIRHRQGT